MLATSATRMDLFLPPIVRFHELPASVAASQLTYAPAMSFHQQATAQQAIDTLRQMESETDTVYYLFVTDAQERLVGVVSLRQLICAAPGARLFEFMDQRQITLAHDAPLDQQARLMSDSGLLALPVVDEDGRLIGAMDVADLIRVLQTTATSEMYELAGLRTTESVEHSTSATAGHRTAWLVASLLIGLLAAWVISSFEGIIASAAVLAAFLPLVARLGSQAGQQTRTFLVRSLALGQVGPANRQQVFSRELLAGLINGAMIGSLAGLAGWLWHGQAAFGLVIGLAVLGNLLLAALLGAGVPLACRALRIGPAQVSTLVVPMVTDLCGFILVLGLGTLALQAGYL